MGCGYGLSALVVLIVGVMIYTYVDFLEQNKTHYAVLGVDQTATSAEIRSAYRRMSLLHHPDKKSQQRREGASGNAPDGEGSHGHRGDNNNQAFYDIVEAYEVLSDDDRRSQYDQELFERAQHREEMRNRYRDQSRRPPRPGDHERHTGNSFHHHFSLSWHLLHLLPMAHPSLQYWASHLMSYLTLRNFLLGLFILGLVGAVLDFVVVQLMGCVRRFVSRLRRRRQLRDPEFVAKQEEYDRRMQEVRARQQQLFAQRIKEKRQRRGRP